MKRLRVLAGTLAALMATSGGLVVAGPAHAAVASLCSNLQWPNGREVELTNSSNGGGSHVKATLCWDPIGNGYYETMISFYVIDYGSDGSGATIRMEWTGTDGKTHYDVPPANQRAWTYGVQADGVWTRNNIKNLYVRACLTNTDREAHHCGPKG
ncbi:hypothetical protein WEI85_47960 [Actinomycetes bacterium KLBMP 9797]